VSANNFPLAPLAVALGAGIALAPAMPVSVAWTLWSAALAGVAGLLALDRARWAWVPLLLGVAALGAARGAELPLPPDHVGRLALPRDARLTGRLAREPTSFPPDRARLLVDVERVDGETRAGRVQVTAYGAMPPLVENQRIAVEARLHAASGFRNPGGFDYAAALRRGDIHVVGTARAERITALEERAPPWHARIKRRALAAMSGALPPASAALLAGLLLGERTDLPREIDEAFRRAGVYHVLAVSGFNVAILAAAVFATLSFIGVPRRLTALVAIGVVTLFAFVVGAQPSVVRATIMAVLVLLALLLDREASVLNSLALAAIVVLALRPADLHDPGFQLSFAATAGIVLAPAPRGWLLGGLVVSLAAQLSVLPITLSHFNQVSTVGLLANLAVVPLAAVGTVVGLVAVALAFVSDAAASVAFNAVWPALLALRAIVRYAASVPGAIVHLPAPPWPAIVSYTAGLGLALAWWRTRADRPLVARRCGGGALAAFVLAGGIEVWPIVRPADGRLRVTVLDVGQGDAIVVELPDRRTLLVDAGPGGRMRLDVGERVVAPYLWNRGVMRLAGVVTTHGDQDHAGGMAAIARLFTTAGHGGAASGPEPAGPTESMSGVRIVSLNPLAGTDALRANERAVVLRLEYGLASFLLTSDIGAPAERAMLAARVPLEATVLKVGHHGARASSTPEFLAAVRPSLAVISVGARNAYGHPAPETLARLAAAGARVLRTDRDGAVIFETDGRVLTVTRWATRRTDRYCLDPEAIC
jgi:competence protein ComEC